MTVGPMSEIHPGAQFSGHFPQMMAQTGYGNSMKTPRTAAFDRNARQQVSTGTIRTTMPGVRQVMAPAGNIAPQYCSPGKNKNQDINASRKAQRDVNFQPTVQLGWAENGRLQTLQKAPVTSWIESARQQLIQTGTRPIEQSAIVSVDPSSMTVLPTHQNLAVIEQVQQGEQQVATAFFYPPGHPNIDSAVSIPMPVPNTQQPPILIYHCTHPHGFFSMFSLVLGHITTCEANGIALYVDWSDPDLLYHGPPGQPNVWQVFFKHPAEVFMSPQVINERLAKQDYTVTEENNLVYGAFKGVIEGYGGIPPECCAHGRALCKRWIHLRPEFEVKLRELEHELLGQGMRWLAVHIRRGDKAVEAASNFALTDEAIISRIVLQCMVWHMDGVFLCSDDQKLKTRIEEQLSQYASPTGAPLACSSYAATLTKDAQCTHMDRSLDGFKKAEDIATEAFLMAKCCHGLISTFSNVSAAVVYLSPEGYPYTTFFEPIDAAALALQYRPRMACQLLPHTISQPMIAPQIR
mmetsp:Transcript_119910/g.208198  ORF Transcript_119910/g.208198 Transcript_119910/m.208198 type:complete len:521 (-) Transcript_119910:242-1804(-)